MCPNAKFVLWDDSASAVSFKDVLAQCDSMMGGGGTSPSCFADSIPADCDLVIVSDGQVNEHEVERCDLMLDGRSFSSVSVFFEGSEQCMNLSVSAPFTRSCKRVSVCVNGRTIASGDTSASIDLSAYMGNASKFLEDAETLLAQVVLQNAGRTNEELRGRLLGLQANLIDSIAAESSKRAGFEQLRSLLQSGCFVDAMAMARTVVAANGKDISPARQVEVTVQEMLRHCSGAKDFSFANLQPGRLARAAAVEAVGTEAIADAEPPVGTTFECPISFDADLPVCLIKQGPPVLAGLSKRYMDSIISCPLFLLENPILVGKLRARVDGIVGQAAAKSLFEQDEQLVSPFSRDPISCALVLGRDSSSRKAVRYTIANLFFGDRLVGQAELWLSVVLFVLRDIPYIRNNPEFVTGLTSLLAHRLTHNTTKITLTAQTVLPLMKSPCDIAVWYCVVSPQLVSTDTPDNGANRLRAFGSAGKHLVEVLRLLGYPFDEPATVRRLRLYSAFAWLMKLEKRGVAWRENLRAQYQNSIELADKTRIFIDGPASPESKPRIKLFGLTVADLLSLKDLVNRNSRLGGVVLGDVPERGEPEAVSHYPIDEQFPGRKHFCAFVKQFKRYPSKEEFVKYAARKEGNRAKSPRDTLPSQILALTDALFDDFKSACGEPFGSITPTVFSATHAKQFLKRKLDEFCVDV